jgi:hypothetical protein
MTSGPAGLKIDWFETEPSPGFDRLAPESQGRESKMLFHQRNKKVVAGMTQNRPPRDHSLRLQPPVLRVHARRIVARERFTAMFLLSALSEQFGHSRSGNFKRLLGVAIDQKKESGMRTFLIAALFAIVPSIGPANAADGCGPGCRGTPGGACVVDGWGTGARIWNECPAGAQPRPPCGYGYVWRPSKRACFPAD